MKKLLSFTTLLIALNVNGQDDCTEDFAAISINYIAPKSMGAGVEYFSKIGLVAGVGAAYTLPKDYVLKQGGNEYQMQTNSFDIYAHVGWRILRVDYLVSVFGNVGYAFGNVDGLSPLTSIKILFPIGTKSVSVEPVYVFGRGTGIKASFHFKF